MGMAFILSTIMALQELANAGEPKCDLFLMGMRMKVTQKFNENTFGAVGKDAGFGQVGRVEYKGKAYSRLTVKTLKSNSFMKSNPQFTQNSSVVGHFNYIGPAKVKLENGFEADVLVIEECPDVHKLIEKKRKRMKKHEKAREESFQKEAEQDRARERAIKKQKKKFEELYE